MCESCCAGGAAGCQIGEAAPICRRLRTTCVDGEERVGQRSGAPNTTCVFGGTCLRRGPGQPGLSTAWPRPSARAWARAVAAASSSVSASVPSAGKRATPADTVIGRPATAGSDTIPSRTRRAPSARPSPARPARTRRHRSARPCRPAGRTRPGPPPRGAARRRRPGGRLPGSWPGSRRCRTGRSTPRSPAGRPGQLQLEDPPTVRSFARPVNGSVCAIRSNQSERSVAVAASRARSTARR